MDSVVGGQRFVLAVLLMLCASSSFLIPRPAAPSLSTVWHPKHQTSSFELRGAFENRSNSKGKRDKNGVFIKPMTSEQLRKNFEKKQQSRGGRGVKGTKTKTTKTRMVKGGKQPPKKKGKVAVSKTRSIAGRAGGSKGKTSSVKRAFSRGSSTRGAASKASEVPPLGALFNSLVEAPAKAKEAQLALAKAVSESTKAATSERQKRKDVGDKEEEKTEAAAGKFSPRPPSTKPPEGSSDVDVDVDVDSLIADAYAAIDGASEVLESGGAKSEADTAADTLGQSDYLSSISSSSSSSRKDTDASGTTSEDVDDLISDLQDDVKDFVSSPFLSFLPEPSAVTPFVNFTPLQNQTDSFLPATLVSTLFVHTLIAQASLFDLKLSELPRSFLLASILGVVATTDSISGEAIRSLVESVGDIGNVFKPSIEKGAQKAQEKIVKELKAEPDPEDVARREEAARRAKNIQVEKEKAALLERQEAAKARAAEVEERKRLQNLVNEAKEAERIKEKLMKEKQALQRKIEDAQNEVAVAKEADEEAAEEEAPNEEVPDEEAAANTEYAEASLREMTVAELKAICKEKKKAITGRKADLIARLLQ